MACSTALSSYPGPEDHISHALQRKLRLQLNHCNRPHSLTAARLGSRDWILGEEKKSREDVPGQVGGGLELEGQWLKGGQWGEAGD